jgi:flagellar basal-body rod protein FlgF/flagellar basal-body rod protein FlgG
MPYGVYLSAAGANAQNHRLQVISHNLANVNTPGFQPEEAVLQARFAEAIERGSRSPHTTEVEDVGGGVTIQPAKTRHEVGTMRRTGNATDFAINDANLFFVVQEGDDRLLTRAGNFVIDANGKLVTPTGQTVLGSSGSPIVVDPRRPLDVGPGGVLVQGDTRQSLMVAKPKSLGDLTRVGENAFRSLTEFDLVNEFHRPVVNHTLEHSAVEPTGAMMQLIEASRAYEANVRMIQNQDSVLGTLIGRVLSS